jgi:hypothetical protein
MSNNMIRFIEKCFLGTIRLTAQSGHSFLQSSTLFGLSHHSDHNIPYPRSSGARFCSAGIMYSLYMRVNGTIGFLRLIIF